MPKIVTQATEVYSEIPGFDPSRSSLHRYLYGPTVASEKLKKVVDHRKVQPLKHILNEMRAFKSENEVVHLRRLGQASGRSFTESMRRTFSTEKELSSFLEYQFKVHGADGSAFVPVVAGGQVSKLAIQSQEPQTHDHRMLWPSTTRGTMMSFGTFIYEGFTNDEAYNIDQGRRLGSC